MIDTRTEAGNIIRNHSLYAMGAGLVPVFILDIVAVTAVQVEMIKNLCDLYEKPYEQTKGKAIVTALAGTTLARVGVSGVASLAKLIPVVGSVVGGATLAVTAGATTFAIGEVFRQHFERGGDLFDLDPEEFNAFYQEQLKKGKDMVQQWKSETTDDDELVPDEPVDVDITPKNKTKTEAPVAEETFPETEDEPQQDDLFVEDSTPQQEENEYLKRVKDAERLMKSGALSKEEFEKIKERLLKQYMKEKKKEKKNKK